MSLLNITSNPNLNVELYQNQIVTFTLTPTNNYSATVNLTSPFKDVKYMQVVSSQKVLFRIDGPSSNNFVYDLTTNQFKQDNIYLPDYDNNIFYKVSNPTISALKVTVDNPSTLLEPSSVSVSLLFSKEINIISPLSFLET